MATTLTGYRVFLASPGGLEDERRVVREEIDRFNRDFMHEAGVAFTAEGWERVPGGKRRAQELINEQLTQGDFMVLLLWNRWGTPPDSEGRHSSGTEEEFRLACDLIDSQDHPMGDILVLFKGVPEAQLSDPGPQLQHVLDFKKELEDSKEWLFKTFDSVEDLRDEVKSRLLAWSKLTATKPLEKASDTTGSPHPASTPGANEIPDDILERAEAYAERGLVTQAEAAYAMAISDNDLGALESYARFLRRVGRLSRSLEIGEVIIDLLTAYPDTAETAVCRSRVMASLGVTQRKLGKLRESRYSLTEAVQAIDGDSEPEVKALAYALDNLGITAVRSGDIESARDTFGRSLKIRANLDDDRGQAETLLNIARLKRRAGDLEGAAADCEEALSLLSVTETSASLAAANSLLGELLQASGDTAGAEAAFREALHQNEAVGRPANIALSLLQIARLLFDKQELSEAERLAERANQENTQASNREGTVAAQHLLGRIACASGRHTQAVGLLVDSVSAYAEMGNPTGEGWARVHLAEALQGLGQDLEASEVWQRAAAIAERTDNTALRSAISQGFDSLVATN